jgi:hypothetical protein
LVKAGESGRENKSRGWGFERWRESGGLINLLLII